MSRFDPGFDLGSPALVGCAGEGAGAFEALLRVGVVRGAEAPRGREAGEDKGEGVRPPGDSF
jgi:hypothetical protein